MTTEEKAWRLMGKVQKWVPAWLVTAAHHAMVVELDRTQYEPATLEDAHLQELSQALSTCQAVIRQEDAPAMAIARCRQILAPHLRK